MNKEKDDAGEKTEELFATLPVIPLYHLCVPSLCPVLLCNVYCCWASVSDRQSRSLPNDNNNTECPTVDLSRTITFEKALVVRMFCY